MNRFSAFPALLFFVLITYMLTGCGGGSNPALPPNGLSGGDGLTVPPTDLTNGNSSGTNSGQSLTPPIDAEKHLRKDRSIWGVWELSIDPETFEPTIVPSRMLEAHYDVTKAVTTPNCPTCIGIKVLNIDPVTHIFTLDITLLNPLKVITGYDVRANLLFPAGDNRELVNADGFTTIFDDTTPADRNPFMAFAKTVANRAFGPKTVQEEIFEIKFPLPYNLKVYFVIDASYPSNQEEPYQIDNKVLTGGINECNSTEGWLSVDMQDWQNNVTSVKLDLKPLGGAIVDMEHVINNHYRYYLNNKYGVSAGTYPLWIEAYSENTTFALYDKYFLEVAPCTNWPPQWDTTVGVVAVNSVENGLEVIYGTASDDDTPVTYNIYWSDTTPIEWTTATKVNDADGSPYVLDGLSDAKTYWVGVRAMDSLGNEEKNTIQMSGTPSAPPTWVSTIGITAANAMDKAVEVLYGVAIDPQTPVTYNIYWSETTPIDFGTALSINDAGSPTIVPGLDNFKTYHFAVRAMDAFGSEDDNTNELPAIPNGAPEWVDTIGIQSTAPGNGSVTVTYGTATDINLPIVYNVYYSETTPIDFGTAPYEVDNNGSPYTVNGLNNNQTYFFAVRAEDSTGLEETNTVELPGTPNSAPTWENDEIGVQSLIPFDEEVTVFYGHAIDPDTPITYYIYYSKSTPINFGTASYKTTTSESPYVVTGLDNYEVYFFAVRAQDNVGIMETNTVELSTIPNPAPIWDSTVGIQSLEAQSGKLIAYYGTASDIDVPVTYRVYYSETSPIDFGTAPYIGDAGGSPTDIPSLENGKTYWATVRAVDSYGHEDQNTVTLHATPLGLPDLKWSVFTGGVVQGSPALADFNGDFILDVVVGNQANNMVAYNGIDGSVIWQFPTGGWVDSSPALANLGGDSTLDVIFGSIDKKMYCVDGATGTELWSVPMGSGIISSPTLANIGGDFHVDVIVGAVNGSVYALDGVDGSAIWNFPTGACIFSSPASADLNDDEIPDIVVGSRDGNVYAINGFTGGQLWSFPTFEWINSSPGLSDFTDDGVPDVVIASLDGDVYCIDGITGGQIWNFPTGSYIWTSPAICYLNGDSIPDVILGADSSNIYAIDGDTGAEIWHFASQDRIWSSAAMADLNDDSVPDAIVGSDDGFMYAIDGASGTGLWAFPTGDWVDSSPAVGDFDNNGSLEIAFGRFDGFLTVITTTDSVAGLTPWPMFRHDILHTALF
ncbi:MAG: PQQ-binding-like beta-propeller repeat protein [bacterium]